MARRFSKKNKRIFKQDSFYQTKLGLLKYLLIRSNARRSLSITINERAEAEVVVPFNCPEKEVHEFISSKAKWIFEKIKEAEKDLKIIESKSFTSGHPFLFLGKSFQLNIKEKDIKRPRIEFDGFLWHVDVPKDLAVFQKEELVKSQLTQWYRKQAEEILGGRLFHYARLMDLTPKKIAIRSFKRIWGNCDYERQAIQLNWQIILSPIKVIDYIVVHELCHLVHPNHGKRFWKKVERFMPDFKEHKRWLSEHSVSMVLP